MNIQPASRLDGVQEYYFAGKLRQIAQMRAEGRTILNLGIGSPDLPPHPRVVETLHHGSASAHTHGYQSYSGIPALREAWAAWYQRHFDVTLNPVTQVLPLQGSKEGILHLAMALLGPGDEALVPDPGYPTYAAATNLAGAGIRTYDLTAQNNWQPDFEALEKTDLSRVKVLWANYPHMPSGAAANTDTLQNLVSFGKKHGILIVHDNPYGFILNDRPQSILACEGGMENAVELNSLSKSHNMAGWRCGVLMGRKDVLQWVLQFKSNLDSGQFLPVQQAAVEALSLGADWFTELNDVYRRRQKLAMACLSAIGCRFDPNQQGLFVWGEVDETHADGFALSDDLLEQSGVFITPGGIFGKNGRRFVRISLCSDGTILREAHQKLLNFSKQKLENQTVHENC
ncbi:MAG: aminotransferase class I/II-fold pyridoxal phosphate-dependent enzyme [Saprospiraceae bacterium]|nr:aminotransferase class I/II-fold pyridoxal phosphate-dependent enzyme [Saprospiraceae bacterium]